MPGTGHPILECRCHFRREMPQCSHTVEFFKDDTTRRCGKCGNRFVNPKMDFGCAAYCQYAEQCLGDLPPELVAQQEALLKDRVAVAVKRHLKTDFKRIGHITRRVRHAEEIARQRQADAKLPVVLITAFLWDLDPLDNVGGAPVTRSILTDLKAPEPLIEQVCRMIAMRDASSADGADAVLDIVLESERRACLEETTESDA